MRLFLTAILVLAAASSAFGGILVKGGTINGTADVTLLSVLVGTFSDSTPDPATNYQATIDWGDGTAFSSGVVSEISGPTFGIFGMHTYSKEGSYSPDLTVSDQDGDTGSGLASALIADAPLTPATVGPLSFMPGVSDDVNVAQFIDADPTALPTDFSATIDWGDNTLSAGVIQTVSGTRFAVFGSHTYSSPASWTITTSVFDFGGATVALQTQATVVPEPASAGLCLAGLLTFHAAFRRRRIGLWGRLLQST